MQGRPARNSMSRTVLGISWLHGQFRAVVLTGSSVSAAWTRPLAVIHDADFAPALAEAVRETRFAGTRVVIALEHRSLLFHVQETPPAKGAMLRQLLDRLVKQNRFFEENAAWGHVALPSGKGRPRYLLALLPESLVQQLTEACAGQHLQLTAVLPLAAVLGSQLRQLPVPPEEIVVLAADLGGALHLLLGRGDGLPQRRPDRRAPKRTRRPGNQPHSPLRSATVRGVRPSALRLWETGVRRSQRPGHSSRTESAAKSRGGRSLLL